MFEKIFKYSLDQYSAGILSFENASSGRLIVIGMIAVVAIAMTVYFARHITNSRHRFGTIAVRSLVILLLLLPFLGPTLIVPDVVPDENFVAVLVDASQSMGILDGKVAGSTRLDDASNVLFGEDEGIAEQLEEHFQLRYYVFDKSVSRTDSVAHVRPNGTGTSLATALERVASDFRGAPLSGIILLTDGGDNGDVLPINIADELGAASIPVHVVGVGSESFASEREILDVSVSKAVEENTGAEIDVKVRSWNIENRPIDFTIYQGDNVVFREARVLKGEGKIDQLSFFFEPPQVGISAYRLEIEKAADEINTENNELELLIDMQKDTTRVLYFEGALRQDFKFIKRALEDDQVVEFVSVSRTGTAKYFRQGVSNSSELAGGFPSEEAELYRYKAVLLGDIEASNFSFAQQVMLEKFVRVRGGGFLMLGGKNSFVDGGYWNTPIAEMLPVHLDLGRRLAIPTVFSRPQVEPTEQGFKFYPTRVGIESPILKLASDSRTNRLRWSGLPGLTSINYLGSPKPGAQVLAVKSADSFGAEEPLLVTQRYGRGRSSALATSSTWRWQMLLESDDTRHERFWRQLVRWLAASAPNPLNVSLSETYPEPGSAVEISATSFDSEYAPFSGAEVSGYIRDPFGTETAIVFDEDLGVNGSYSTTFVPQDEGIYHLAITAVDGDDMLDSRSTSFFVRKSRDEFKDATLKKSRLEGLAAASGGAYYSSDDVSRLPERLRTRKTTTTVYQSNALWDMPFIFGLMIVMLSFDWYFRRKNGLK